MSYADISDYDADVRAIQAYNEPILDDFRTWLKQCGYMLCLRARGISKKDNSIPATSPPM